MQAYFTINTSVELFCFVVSLLCLYNDKDPVWRGFILFLFSTCLFEFVGIFTRNELHKANFMVYNVYLVVECFTLSYFFYHLYSIYHSRKTLLLVWLAIFFVFFAAELYKNRLGNYAFAASTLEAIALVLASVYYFYLVLREEEYRQLFAYAPFWWVSGTICFYFASTASNIFFNYLAAEKAPVVSHSARYILFNILNVILYLNWSYSFVCRYRQRTSYSLSD